MLINQKATPLPVAFRRKEVATSIYYQSIYQQFTGNLISRNVNIWLVW